MHWTEPATSDDFHALPKNTRWYDKNVLQASNQRPGDERGSNCLFGVLPTGNANFGCEQHSIHYLAPQGMAGFVFDNGSVSSNQSIFT